MACSKNPHSQKTRWGTEGEDPPLRTPKPQGRATRQNANMMSFTVDLDGSPALVGASPLRVR